MSRQIWLAWVLASFTGCSGCSKPAGNQQKDPGPTTVEKVPVPKEPGPNPGPTPNQVKPISDDERFHLHPEEGTMTVGSASGKAGGELAASIKVTPATGLHLATDFPIKIILEAPQGVKLTKSDLTAGGR